MPSIKARSAQIERSPTMTVDSSKIEDKEASQALEGVVEMSANAEEDEFSEINFSPASVRRKPKRPSMFVTSESFLDDSQPHLNEVSYHPGNTPFYSPPKQRQRWVRAVFALVLLFATNLRTVTHIGLFRCRVTSEYYPESIGEISSSICSLLQRLIM